MRTLCAVSGTKPLRIQNRSNAQRVILSLIMLCLSSLISAPSGQAQEDTRIKKDKLISSFSLGKAEGRKAEWYVELIKREGVGFKLTAKDEREIREAGSYLGKTGLDKLVAAIEAYGGKRLRVSLFNYDSCGKYQKNLEGTLNADFRTLPDRFGDQLELYNHVAKLRLVQEGKASSAMNVAEISSHWETTNSLQVLLGTCSEEDKTVVSQVFLGSLRGDLPSIIRVRTKIDPAAYGDTEDIHNLLILYSLAKDAQVNGEQKPNVIITYLSAAYSLAATCKYEKLSTEDPVKQIITDVKTAIIKMFVSIGAQAPPPPTC